jgi:hypothetical protein
MQLGRDAGDQPDGYQADLDRYGLKPRLTKDFEVSRDMQSIEMLYDVSGLYLNPPDKALVLFVDEKSQIQAHDRTQRGLPLKKG